MRLLLLCCWILPANPAHLLIFLVLLNIQTRFDPHKCPSRPLAAPCNMERGSESEMEGISARQGQTECYSAAWGWEGTLSPLTFSALTLLALL